MNFPVDAVITWVDGGDPVHCQKINRYKNLYESEYMIRSSLEGDRFSNNGEIFYCVQSIIKYMPWIRKIFIITDSQIPQFLSSDNILYEKVIVVDHTVVFEGHEDFLPTFNSISIESVIQNIPDLSEHYIYFNDDFVVLDPVSPKEFFTDDGVVLKGEWKKMVRYNRCRIEVLKIFNLIVRWVLNINSSMSLLQQMKAAQLAGFNKYYLRYPHCPHPQRKSIIVEFYKNNKSVYLDNIKYRFRNLAQHVAVFLSSNLEIVSGKAKIVDSSDCLMISFNRDLCSQISKKIKLVRDNGSIKYLCIQSLEEATEAQRNRLVDALAYRGLGEKR